MSTDFDKLREIFLAALELAPDQRGTYLDQRCAGDEELRRNVAVMLKAHAAGEGPLDRGALRDEQTGAYDHAIERSGTVIGAYKLIEQIGEGGMGTVWMAQQTEPVKRVVALKHIKAGMDSRQVIARFEAERQALALMDHANIARVLDAGTTSAGRPYFIMDLVKGVPITKYCDEHHLTPRQRLELFIPVCQAVQHAHQKGIIHRDLKPSNVLVALYDGKPVPKVIDFGVAKAAGQSLTDKTLVTGFGNIVGTLEYMSPEQAEINQLDIDTRSDIYSLGVLLYELLTGSPPFSRKDLEKAGMLEMLRVIREQEPSKPSTKLSTAEGLPTLAANRGTEPAKLTKLVRGELDWIVMKALEKDRNRRYETANGLARDVERYLKDEPVQACAPTAWYRFRKFARRNRVPLMTAGFVLAALILGTAVSIWQAVRATQAFEAEKQARNQADVNLEETRRAEREKTRHLAIAYVREAQARRNGGLVGRRFDSLEALQNAAEQFQALGDLDENRTLELRNEAIACLVLADMKPAKTWTPQPGWSQHRWFDPTLQYYAVRTAADDHPTQPDRQQGHLSIRRAADDQEIALLPGFGVRVTAAQFSPNGRYLAAHYGDWGHPLHNYVWDLSRREQILKESHNSYDHLPSFSPDSQLVAHPRPDHSVRIYALSSGATWKDLPPGLPVSRGLVSFQPNGHQLAAVSGGTVQLRDLSDGKELATFTHPSGVYALAWRSDGKVFATGCNDNDIYLWDVANPAHHMRILKGHVGSVVHLTFSHGGDLLFSSSWDSTDRLWDPMTGQQLASRPGGMYHEYFFSPDDQRLDDGWQVASGRECRTFHGHKKPPRGVTICPSGPFGGRLMASFSKEGMRLWDLAASREGDKLLDTRPVGESMSVHVDPTGESLITDSNRIGLQRWPITPDPETGGLRIGPPQSLGLSARAPFFAKDSEFTLSADGRTVAHSPRPGQVLLYDLENPRRKLLIESPCLCHLAFSPDGRWLATGNWHGRGAKVWHVQTGKLEADLDLGDEENARLAFSPNDQWLVTGTNAEYRFWEVGSWQKKHGLPRENAGQALGLIVFAPDSKMLAVLHNMTEVRLVDSATGREFARLPGAGGPYCFSPDGSQLVTYAGREGAFQVWDLRLIRRQLKEMDLDWDLPPYPPPSPFSSLQQEQRGPLRVRVLPAEPLPPSKELDAEAHRERALLRARLRQYTEATADFKQASALDAKRSPWEEVARGYTKAIDLRPNDGALRSNRGSAYIQLGQHNKAIADYSKAIELQPDDASFWSARGFAYGRLGEWSQALADHAKAAELKPTDPAVCINHGFARAQLGQWKEAAAAFEHATTLKPDDPLTWYYLALLALQRGDRAGYQKACVRMLEQFGESRSADAAYCTAWTCVLAPDAVADWTKPLKLAEKAHADVGKSYARIRTLGAVLYRAGRFKEAAQRLAEAEAAYRETPRKDFTIVYTWLFQAMAYHQLGHTSEAANWLEKAVHEIDEPSPETAQNPATKHWNWRLRLQLLRREAEDLLKKEPGVRKQESEKKPN